MQAHYFDIETYSPGEKPDPEKDKIISVQFQKIDLKTGEKLGRLQILKEWETSEEEIVKLIYKWFFKQNPWKFIPVGFNLAYEWQFFSKKFEKYGLEKISVGDFLEKFPQVDLKALAVIRKGEFLGASLSSISNKIEDGHVIKDYYANNEYDKIMQYIENEACSFIELYSKIVKNLGMMFD